MKPTTFNYIVYGIAIVVAAVFLLGGCSSPEKTMNFFTPDRLGYGIMNGTMNWKGVGEIETIWQSDIGDIYWDLDGEQQTTMLYLEWDLPQWNESNYDRYLRDSVRQLSIELEMANESAQIEEEDGS